MAIAHRYTRPDQYYINSDEDYGCPPYNSTPDALPPRPWKNQWPQYVDNKGWVLVEDHRQRAEPHFAAEDVQPGTDYWLPEDTYLSPARHMQHPGPLPANALTKRPEQPLAEVKAAKNAIIIAAHESALAGAVALSDPTPSTVAVEAGLLAVSDPEGLEYVRNSLAARRDALLAAVEAAKTAQDVQAIAVSSAV
ncbi:phage tail protein [uncultured Desulfovibrio sp.]|uniref:phage tail protein n=2 Tax=uncultured Desulfovibrio sp. TaxID=167968 RepID=UPI00266EB82E|nr:phage tail protein [uncultured Desulfovibrio sp.]